MKFLAAAFLGLVAVSMAETTSPRVLERIRREEAIMEQEKILADPRGLSRERRRRATREHHLKYGIVLGEEYDYRRKLIGYSNTKEFYPSDGKPTRRLTQIDNNKQDEDLEFWQRLLKTGEKDVSVSMSIGTDAPSASPSASPTASPSASPSASPTASPSASPSSAPTASPSDSPTASPSATPTSSPAPTGSEPTTDAPTASPSGQPSAPPVDVPVPVAPVPVPVAPVPVPVAPVPVPVAPVPVPVAPVPTDAPVEVPVPVAPVPVPVAPVPVPVPVVAPTAPPTDAPVNPPTSPPTDAPVNPPTNPPTNAPVNPPTNPPTDAPVNPPTNPPTNAPVNPPTVPPTVAPVPVPTAPPTLDPITQLIISVSLDGGASLSDPDAYQAKALNWLLSSNTANLSNARLVQRWVLACIYFATFEVRTIFTDAAFGEGNVLPWLSSTNWVTDANECDWTKVDCDENNSVTILDLFSNILTGEFPREVELLSATLEILDIGDNFVFADGVDINQSLGKLTNLRDLRYDQTNFLNDNGIPLEINNLKALEFYACASTIYRGPLNANLFPSDMVNLIYIEIEFNAYNSTVPANIGRLPALQRFYVRDSFIDGDLSWMQNMPAIVECFVGSNPGLGGTLPAFLGSLSTLANFFAADCNFSGRLPTELGQLGDSMIRLSFRDNQLTGPIPAEYGALTLMDRFEIQDNMLTGTIPFQVCGLTFANLEILTADCVNCPPTPCCDNTC